MSWVFTTLGEYFGKTKGLIQTGPFGSSLHQSDYREKGFPVIMPKDITNDRVSVDSIARIGIEDKSRLAKHIVSEGDIVYPRRGEITKRAYITINEVGFICGTGCILIRNNSKELNSLFLNYFLADKSSTDWLENNAVGATMKNLSGGILKKLPLSIPPINTQKRIADILSAYDDLIENNLKRVKLLEQAAQNIYKEWFVNMRFSGHENAVVNNDTGLPSGWTKVLAKDYFNFKRGIEVGSKNYVTEATENTIPFLRVGSLGSRDNDIFTEISLVKDKILKFTDVAVSMDGSIGLVGYGLVGAYSTGLRKVIPKSDKYGFGFIYCLLKSEDIQDTIRAYAKGSTILHASSSIDHLNFNNAPSGIANQFNSIIEPIYSQMLNLNKQIQKLKAARDILLPRLMNRTIEV